MSFKCGIVGLPNIGKSTLFNALTNSNMAEVANYEFCTIHPNTGIISVPDERLDALAAIANSMVKKYTKIDIVDIAGLIKDAHKGAGLGNLFLSHVREVDAIMHVVRCFDSGIVSHVLKRVDPLSDIEIINLELIMADLMSLEKKLPTIERNAKKNIDDDLLDNINIVLSTLRSGKMASESGLDKEILKKLQLITSKPVLYVCNVDEASVLTGNRYSDMVFDKFSNVVLISAAIEAELSSIDDEEKKIFMNDFNISGSYIGNLIRASYDLLGLQTFFTVGEKEARAWTVKKGAIAPQAAAEIHSDMEKGFIKADTIAFDDYIQYNGESGCRDAGKLRQEGRDYVVQDGDVFYFKFNV